MIEPEYSTKTGPWSMLNQLSAQHGTLVSVGLQVSLSPGVVELPGQVRSAVFESGQYVVCVVLDSAGRL